MFSDVAAAVAVADTIILNIRNGTKMEQMVELKKKIDTHTLHRKDVSIGTESKKSKATTASAAKEKTVTNDGELLGETKTKLKRKKSEQSLALRGRRSRRC